MGARETGSKARRGDIWLEAAVRRGLGGLMQGRIEVLPVEAAPHTDSERQWA
jgi:hypothetical protein